jgi:hypothetical protein
MLKKILMFVVSSIFFYHSTVLAFEKEIAEKRFARARNELSSMFTGERSFYSPLSKESFLPWWDKIVSLKKLKLKRYDWMSYLLKNATFIFSDEPCSTHEGLKSACQKIENDKIVVYFQSSEWFDRSNDEIKIIIIHELGHALEENDHIFLTEIGQYIVEKAKEKALTGGDDQRKRLIFERGPKDFKESVKDEMPETFGGLSLIGEYRNQGNGWDIYPNFELNFHTDEFYRESDFMGGLMRVRIGKHDSIQLIWAPYIVGNHDSEKPYAVGFAISPGVSYFSAFNNYNMMINTVSGHLTYYDQLSSNEKFRIFLFAGPGFNFYTPNSTDPFEFKYQDRGVAIMSKIELAYDYTLNEDLTFGLQYFGQYFTNIFVSPMTSMENEMRFTSWYKKMGTFLSYHYFTNNLEAVSEGKNHSVSKVMIGIQLTFDH